MTTSGATAAPQSDATPPTWLVMVYMQAGDTSQLDNLATQDLSEMEAGVRENPHVQVLVQIQRKWPAVPQRYLLKSGELPKVIPGPFPKDKDDNLLNMGSREALKDFLFTGLVEGQPRADKYCLVLWGHAFGLGFGRDHGDALHLDELQAALEGFRKELGDRLNILATNSCAMSYIEAAFQLRKDVQYMVASQVFVPLTGLPYKEILSGINSQTVDEQLGQMIVDRYVEHFVNSPQGERVAMALLNLDGAETFNDKLNGIAETITKIVGGPSRIDFQRLSEIQDVFFVNPAGDVRPVLDLRGLAVGLRELADDLTAPTGASQRTRHAAVRPENQGPDAQSLQELRRQADQLATAIDGPAISGQAGVAVPGTRSQESEAPASTSLVVHHNEHPDLKELHGVGVFAPFVVDKEFRKRLEIDNPKSRGHDDLQGRGRYELLKIFTEGGERRNWPTLVYETLRLEEPDEIVDATGVVLPAERLQVNQLLAAVEAAFNRLDRFLTNTEPQLVAAVSQTKKDDPHSKAILATFGPPRLKLAADLSLEDPERFTGVAWKEALPSKAGLSIVPTLERIEQAVQLVEKTTKRVVTNRTFGLGPPSSGRPTLMHLGPKQAGDVFGPKQAGDVFGPKQAGDVFGPKQAGDVFGPKQAGDVFGPKQAGDVFGPMGSETVAVLALLSADAQVAGLAVSALFTQVALALSRLEQAAATIEFAAAQFLFTPVYGKMLSPEEFEKSVKIRFSREFGIMREVSLQARRNIRRILAHPVYGLGPGPEGLGQEERDELAIAAGLSRRNLLLL